MWRQFQSLKSDSLKWSIGEGKEAEAKEEEEVEEEEEEGHDDI